MRSRKKLTLRQWLIYLFILFIIIPIILLLYIVKNDRAQFRRLSEKLFHSELSSNSLNLHYTLAYPENYGIDTEILLPVYTGPSQAGSKEELSALSRSLSKINPGNLSKEDAYAYELLMRLLSKKQAGADFSYYAEPFSPGSGIQSGLPILLADYAFRRKEDVEHYLSLLDQTDDYLEGLLQYETEKANAGLFMSDTAAREVIEQCTVILDKAALSKGSHFLQTTFWERLSPLIKEGSLTGKEGEKFKSENDRLLTTVMAPAYEQAADVFTILMGSGKNDKGLFYLPKGKSYYEYLLSLATGSDRSVPEIKRLLFEDFQKNYQEMTDLIASCPESCDPALVPSFALPLSSPAKALQDLQERMSGDFPSFPSQKQNLYPSCTIKQVSASMESYTAPAYYLTPPIDDMRSNVIYINGKNRPDNLTLYTTLAHEGYPGHLYQTVYSQLHMQEQEAPSIRYLLSYGGYVEGWAFYVEDLSYQYAKEQVKNNPYAASYYEACRLNRNLHLALYSLLDIAIHYEGADEKQAGKLLESLGVTDSEAASSLYHYIVQEPANYLKYYLGFLELQELKKEAASLWGDGFSLYRFHQFVLDAGPSDFTSLKKRLLSLPPSCSPDSPRPTEGFSASLRLLPQGR